MQVGLSAYHSRPQPGQGQALPRPVKNIKKYVNQRVISGIQTIDTGSRQTSSRSWVS